MNDIITESHLNDDQLQEHMTGVGFTRTDMETQDFIVLENHSKTATASDDFTRINTSSSNIIKVILCERRIIRNYVKLKWKREKWRQKPFTLLQQVGHLGAGRLLPGLGGSLRKNVDMNTS